jgi:hypothetical protein
MIGKKLPVRGRRMNPPGETVYDKPVGGCEVDRGVPGVTGKVRNLSN